MAKMIYRFKKEEGKQLIFQSYDKLLELWGLDIEEKDIETTYGTTHLIITGKRDNPPLILFHGVGDNSAIMWIYNIQELAKHFFIIAIDTIGGPGKSEPNKMYFENMEQSKWINEILDAFNISKTNIAGVSNGVYLANYYTINNKERVNRIVCMAGGVTVSMLRMALLAIPDAIFVNKKSTKNLLRKMCGTNYDVFLQNDDLLLHWYYLLKYFNNMSMAFHKYTKFTKEDLLKIKEKSLFLIGEFDKLVNYPKAIKALKDNNINYKLVNNAGHAINHQQPELVNNEIIKFLLSENTL